MQHHPEDEALTTAFPELAGQIRVGALLNPTSGLPDAGDSSVGGPLLWPHGEPWPVCSVGHRVSHREPLSEAERLEWRRLDAARGERVRNGTGQAHVLIPGEAAAYNRIMNGADSLDMVAWERVGTRPDPCVEPVAMVPVLQLHARDVPRAFQGRDADLLQVLWCPNDHVPEAVPGGYPYGGPRLVMRWRRTGRDPLAPIVPPRPRRAADRYIPRPCTVDPVEQADFPERDELPAGLEDTVEAWCEDRDFDYHEDFACLGGWKVGGWPSWHLTDLQRITCRGTGCGQRMRLFLTMTSGGDPSLSVGRFGELRVFLCPDVPDHPIALNIQ